MPETIDVEATNVQALAVRPASLVPDFVTSIDAAVAKVEAKHDFFRRVMRRGQHYGTIPGVKPAEGEGERFVLLKPGAELLINSMGLQAILDDASPPVERQPTEGLEGEYTYRRRCRIYRQLGPAEGERVLVAQAEGLCTSLEKKYRYRDSKRACPACGAASIIVGKKEYGGGFICFAKMGGCGAKYSDEAVAITEQKTGRIPNPDLADTANTILKMADKRALVAATLIATGCSDIFTQDVGDDEDEDAPLHAPPPPRATRTQEVLVKVKPSPNVASYAADAPLIVPTPAHDTPGGPKVDDTQLRKDLRNAIARAWQGVPEEIRQATLKKETGQAVLHGLETPKLEEFLENTPRLLKEAMESA